GEAAHGVAVKPHRDDGARSVNPKIGVVPTLHDPEQRLIGPPARRQAPSGPSVRAEHRLLHPVAGSGEPQALIKRHDDVRSEGLQVLPIDSFYRAERPDRHEGGSVDLSMSGAQSSQPRQSAKISLPHQKSHDAQPVTSGPERKYPECASRSGSPAAPHASEPAARR